MFYGVSNREGQVSHVQHGIIIVLMVTLVHTAVVHPTPVPPVYIVAALILL
jgi:hypothetical protein